MVGRIRTCAGEPTWFLVMPDNHSGTTTWWGDFALLPLWPTFRKTCFYLHKSQVLTNKTPQIKSMKIKFYNIVWSREEYNFPRKIYWFTKPTFSKKQNRAFPFAVSISVYDVVPVWLTILLASFDKKPASTFLDLFV